METFPSLNISREKCSACVINEKYLYVFFGFDRTKNKFEISIERIVVQDPMSWEMINIAGNQNILKKQSFSCIPLTRDEQSGVIITGGINSLRNETKEQIDFIWSIIENQLVVIPVELIENSFRIFLIMI